MKKTRFLAGVLVLALMMMGAGFAAWTQSFTVTNTVDTGELKIDIADSTATIDDIAYVVENIEVDEASEAVTVDLDDLYPGAVVNFSFVVTNNGTIPVQLKSIEEKLSGLEENETDMVTITHDALKTDVIEPLGTKKITYTVTFDEKASNDLENSSVTLKATPVYGQTN